MDDARIEDEKAREDEEHRARVAKAAADTGGKDEGKDDEQPEFLNKFAQARAAVACGQVARARGCARRCCGVWPCTMRAVVWRPARLDSARVPSRDLERAFNFRMAGRVRKHECGLCRGPDQPATALHPEGYERAPVSLAVAALTSFAAPPS